MTLQDFTKRFNELISAPTPDLSALAAFRTEVEQDYTAHETLNTTLTTAQSRITELETQNKTLHDVNLRLFMMNPTASNEPQQDPEQTPPTPPQNQDPEPPSIEDITALLVGNKKKEE